MYIQGKMQVHKREKGRSQTQCSISGIRCALGIVSDPVESGQGPQKEGHYRSGSIFKVGRVGFEPTRVLPRRILSPLRLPFRHRPKRGTIWS